MKKFLALNLSDVVFIMLINVKMPMSRINFVLSWVEHEKSFITSGQVYWEQGEFDEFISPDEGLLRETCKSQNINPILSSP